MVIAAAVAAESRSAWRHLDIHDVSRLFDPNGAPLLGSTSA
jgi:hypothetical protein